MPPAWLQAYTLACAVIRGFQLAALALYSEAASWVFPYLIQPVEGFSGASAQLQGCTGDVALALLLAVRGAQLAGGVSQGAVPAFPARPVEIQAQPAAVRPCAQLCSKKTRSTLLCVQSN